MNLFSQMAFAQTVEGRQRGYEYQPLVHTRQLLHKRIGCPNSEQVNALAEILERKNLNKLRRRIDEWKDCQGRIPMAALEFFGISVSELEETVEADRQALKESLRHLPIPGGFSERVFPAIYRFVPFPEGITTVNEALEFAVAYAKDVGRNAHIRFGNSAIAWIRGSDGDCGISLGEPEMVVESDSVHFLIGGHRPNVFYHLGSTIVR